MVPPAAEVSVAASHTATGVAGGIIKAVVIVAVSVVGAAAGAAIFIPVLIFTGSPAACVDRHTDYSAAASQELRVAWDAFSRQITTASGSLSITEAQATSRAIEYVEEQGVPIEELQLYFCPGGTAEASGKLSVLGRKATVVISGTIDLSGERPRIHVDSIRAGNLPSAAAVPVVNLVLDTGDFRTLDLDEPLRSISFVDETATVTGGP